jgi:hypothetical protein
MDVRRVWWWREREVKRCSSWLRREFLQSQEVRDIKFAVAWIVEQASVGARLELPNLLPDGVEIVGPQKEEGLRDLMDHLNAVTFRHRFMREWIDGFFCYSVSEISAESLKVFLFLEALVLEVEFLGLEGRETWRFWRCMRSLSLFGVQVGGDQTVNWNIRVKGTPTGVVINVDGVK